MTSFGRPQGLYRPAESASDQFSPNLGIYIAGFQFRSGDAVRLSQCQLGCIPFLAVECRNYPDAGLLKVSGG